MNFAIEDVNDVNNMPVDLKINSFSGKFQRSTFGCDAF